MKIKCKTKNKREETEILAMNSVWSVNTKNIQMEPCMAV